MPQPMMSPAATDLGLGGSLADQLKAQEEERKKKLLAQQRAQESMATGAYGPATATLFPTL